MGRILLYLFIQSEENKCFWETEAINNTLLWIDISCFPAWDELNDHLIISWFRSIVTNIPIAYEDTRFFHWSIIQSKIAST